MMKKVLMLEEIGQTALSIVGIYRLHTGIAWWWLLLLFFSPDISMLGYLVNTKMGAICYNVFHHKLLAVAMIIIGFVGENQNAMLIGLLLYGHASFDRIMGYGLKHFDAFKHTHLGMLK
jgi:hypothetical protein